MIIAGNSHVSMFRGGLVIPERGQKEVRTHWLGALKFEHFRAGHPAAVRVRKLLSAEQDWKFLCIGNHDILALCDGLNRSGTAEPFNRLIAESEAVFSELNANGRFGWMICLQQIYEKEGITAAMILEVTKLFNTQLTAWCSSANVLVIDPSLRYGAVDGTAKPEFLQADGLHLNAKAGQFFLDEIAQRTGIVVSYRHSASVVPADAQPLSEVESFCQLAEQELGLQPTLSDERSWNLHALANQVLQKVNEKLAERGIDAVQSETDFVTEGLLDSLELVEVYDFAASLLGESINFDVDLRALPTAQEISAFLLTKLPKSGPQQGDLLHCLNAESQSEIASAFQADLRIACMTVDLAQRLVETGASVFGTAPPVYGVFSFWVALIEAQKGNFTSAASYAMQAARAVHSFEPRRLQSYLASWSKGVFLAVEPPNVVPSASNGQRVWDLPVDENIIRMVSVDQSENTRERDANESIMQGQLHLAEGRLENAKLCFWHALETIGIDDVVLNSLGQVFMREGNYKDALGHFQQALGLNPGNRNVAMNLAEALTAVGRGEEAKSLLASVLR